MDWLDANWPFAAPEWLAALFSIDGQNDRLENLSFIATLFGVPVLLLSYIGSLIAEGHRREVGTYDTLETQYVEFQKLALANPQLDVVDSPLAYPPALQDQDLARQRTLYMVLFSLFERAYLLYKPSFPFGRLLRSRTRRQQWTSWVSYIDRYLTRESCRNAWFDGQPPREDVGQDFDPRFEKFMYRRMRKQGHMP